MGRQVAHGADAAADVAVVQHVVFHHEAAHVGAQPSHDVPPACGVLGCGKQASVGLPVVGQQCLLAVVAHLLRHECQPRVVAEVVQLLLPRGGELRRVQPHAEFVFLLLVFIFPTVVLLQAQRGEQGARAEVQLVVPSELVVVHHLEGQFGGVALGVGGEHKATVGAVAFALHDARHQVVVREAEAALPPVKSASQLGREGAPSQLRTRHVAVGMVAVGVGRLLAVVGAVEEAPLGSAQGGVPPPQPVDTLVLPSGVEPQFPIGQGGGWPQHDDAPHGVRPVHQRGGAFDDFHCRHVGFVQLHSVLIAPLLTLLPYVVAHYDDAVVAQTADDGLGNTSAGGYLRHARLVAQRVDEVGGCGLPQCQAVHGGDCHRGVGGGGLAGRAADVHLVQGGTI